MKAWRDYTLVVAKDITPAEVNKLMAEIEENLVDFENTFEMINKYNLGGVDLGREIKSDDEKLRDFLRNLAKMFSLRGAFAPLFVLGGRVWENMRDVY